MYNKTILKMKKISVFMVIAAIGLIVASCGNGYNANVKLKSDVDSALYAVGVVNGVSFRDGLQTFPGAEGQGNYDALITGFAAAINDKPLKMTPDEAQIFLQTYVTEAQEKEMRAIKAEGEAFLATNKSKAGVITTESGLQYKAITEGTGAKPTTQSIIIVHYTGKFLNGTVFDSSVERGEPVEFLLSDVIQGWIEVLQLMPVGSKYQVWIPYELAYGEQGNQGIKPYSALEFEIELLGIKE